LKWCCEVVAAAEGGGEAELRELATRRAADDSLDRKSGMWRGKIASDRSQEFSNGK
jgi:hypothetical protein